MWKYSLAGVTSMETVIFRASKRVYIVFGIMFGWMPIAITILAYSKNKKSICIHFWA
jgi:hypothetical protein